MKVRTTTEHPCPLHLTEAIQCKHQEARQVPEYNDKIHGFSFATHYKVICARRCTWAMLSAELSCSRVSRDTPSWSSRVKGCAICRNQGRVNCKEDLSFLCRKRRTMLSSRSCCFCLDISIHVTSFSCQYTNLSGVIINENIKLNQQLQRNIGHLIMIT